MGAHIDKWDGAAVCFTHFMRFVIITLFVSQGPTARFQMLGVSKLYANAFIFTVFFLVVGIALPIGALAVLGPLLRPNRPTPGKVATYESGLAPMGDARARYNVRYYLYALLFVVFDVEILFLYPWAVEYHRLGLFGFTEMLVFILLLAVGLIYAWRKKVLEWR